MKEKREKEEDSAEFIMSFSHVSNLHGIRKLILVSNSPQLPTTQSKIKKYGASLFEM